MFTAEEIEKVSSEDLQKIIDIIKREIKNRRALRKKCKKIHDIRNVPPKNFGAIPTRKKHYSENIDYINYLLSQDWRHLFKEKNLDAEKKYYVYAHVRPKTANPLLLQKLNIFGEPFYIGKGTGNRAFDLKRNQGHGIKLREQIKRGYSCKQIANIIFDNLSEFDALIVEAKLIYFFGTIYEKNREGILYNIDNSLRPDFNMSAKDFEKYYKTNHDDEYISNSVIVRKKQT